MGPLNAVEQGFAGGQLKYQEVVAPLLEVVNELGNGSSLRRFLPALGEKTTHLLTVLRPCVQQCLLHEDTPPGDLRIQCDQQGWLQTLRLLIGGEVIGLEKPIASQLQG